jgi:hypothetical protein
MPTRTPIDIAKDLQFGLTRAHQDIVAQQLSCWLAVCGAYAPNEAADPGADSLGMKLTDAQRKDLRSVIVSSHTDDELYKYQGDRRGHLAVDEAIRLRLDPNKPHPFEKIRHVDVDRRKALDFVTKFLQAQTAPPAPVKTSIDGAPTK